MPGLCDEVKTPTKSALSTRNRATPQSALRSSRPIDRGLTYSLATADQPSGIVHSACPLASTPAQTIWARCISQRPYAARPSRGSARTPEGGSAVASE